MESLKINDAIRSREEWMDIAGLPEKLRQNVMAADVLIVPSMLQDQPKVFMVGTMDLYTILKKNLGIRGTGTSIHAFMCLKNVCKW